jgi:hypothetical protein
VQVLGQSEAPSRSKTYQKKQKKEKNLAKKDKTSSKKDTAHWTIGLILIIVIHRLCFRFQGLTVRNGVRVCGFQRSETKIKHKNTRFRVFSLPGVVRNVKPTHSLPTD